MIRGQNVFKVLISVSLVFCGKASLLALTESEARDQVTRLYQRLAGVPPTAQQLMTLTPSMQAGDPAPTVFAATQEDSFYKTTLVRIFSPFSNVEGRIDESGNDFNATLVGLVRDNEDFRQVISGDVLYTANDAAMNYEISILPPINDQPFTGNFNSTVDRCPLSIRTKRRPTNPALRIPSETDWQRDIGDPGYDIRYDAYRISVNNGGARPAIPASEPDGMDEFGVVRVVPAMAAQSESSPYPDSRFPLFSSRGYGDNNSPNPNLSWAVCHQWQDFRNNPPAGKVRPLGREESMNNFSYRLEDAGISHYTDLVKFPNWPQLLVKRTQSQFYSALSGDQSGNNGAGSEWNKDVAGVMTTLTGGKAYFLAGTNRRAISMTFLNWLGYSMEQLHDPNVSIQYIRQDLIPEEKCTGCHGKMDPMANATNRIDYNDNRLKLYFNMGGGINDKLFRGCRNPNSVANCIRPSGFDPRQFPVNDQNRWWNLATLGRNSFLGWRVPPGMSSKTEGVGFNSLMKVFANTEAFSNRMIDLATKTICLRNQTPAELDESALKARAFETGISDYTSQNAGNPYNLRAAFAEAAKTCFGRIEQ